MSAAGMIGEGERWVVWDSMKLIKMNKVLLAATLLVAIGILLGILSVMQMNQNKKQVDQTTAILLDQICKVIDSNQAKENVLVESLKEDYITRAKAVSYTIDCKPELEEDIEELMKIAHMMKVDEIHLFDVGGSIYRGTEPQYYGFSFDSGEQMGYFKPMLTDKSLSMCQDVTPNTAEAKMMMYAICWNETGTRMLQVGIEPKRLMEELRTNSVREMMQEMPTYLGVTMVVADGDTGEIQGATSTLLVGKTLAEIGVNSGGEGQERILAGSVYGKGSYYKVRSHKGYVVAVIQEKSVVHKDVPLILGIVSVYFVIAVGVSLLIILKLVAHTDSALKHAKTDALTGLLNRRGYDNSVLARGKAPLEDNFVYVSMDLNGLKQANDTFGHEVGDKLIRAAASCIKECFGEYGELFRVGGDEFAAMIEADDQQLETTKAEFENIIAHWCIHIGMELSISCGYVRHKEFPDKQLAELAKIADLRMYEAKQAHYRTRGTDRRRR